MDLSAARVMPYGWGICRRGVRRLGHPVGCPSSATAGVASGSRVVATVARSAMRAYLMSRSSDERTFGIHSTVALAMLHMADRPRHHMLCEVTAPTYDCAFGEPMTAK